MYVVAPLSVISRLTAYKQHVSDDDKNRSRERGAKQYLFLWNHPKAPTADSPVPPEHREQYAH
jgi:hypothetical protein